MTTPGRTKLTSARLLAFALTAWFALAALTACGDEGTSTSCDEMPAPTPDDPNDDLSDAKEVQDWWKDAVKDGCATAPLGDGATNGAAGAGN